MSRRSHDLPRQLELRPPRPPRRHPKWGGARDGAGRRPTGHAGVPHGRREAFSSRHPVHVTLRLRREVGALRRGRLFAVLREAFRAGCDREGFRLCHFNVLSNHIHLLCEAKQVDVLSRGVQGLEVRIARSVNRTLGRSGRVFADRYHMRVLRTPSETRACLVYVLQNQRKHVGARVAPDWFDPFSSAPWFDGWSEPLPTHEPWMRQALAQAPCVAPAHTWLLTVGWRARRGPLSLAVGPVGAKE
jgi:putative transposase